MRLTFSIIISILFLNCKAQIVLKGYKCLLDPAQIVGISAEMYSKNDTFYSYFYARDIMDPFDDNGIKDGGRDREQVLKVGLSLCFNSVAHYIRTKDNLYVGYGKDEDANIYFYRVYIPERELSISVRSNKNDATLSSKSKWLLSQIRRHRKKNLVLMNEKHENCLGYPF